MTTDLAPEEDALTESGDTGGEDEDTLHRRLGLTDAEYQRIVEILGREPRPAELAMYSVMWSEHCSYKSSRVHLGRFPTEAPWVVVGPGENAGVIDLGDGWLAAFRIESHNHPSYVEPYQGAATGVGGILRDVFTMGARPIALWDQIRFGPLDNPKNRYLFSGVVSGIAGYGNAVGVPTVGGEIAFEECYSGNPLVNVMCLGILRRDQLVLGTAGKPGNVAMLLGAATGRDGIGGASILASASFDEESATKRPSVQVGDPFEEKKLIEACLELYQKDLVVGVQDLGAAGLSCAAAEPAARAGVGMELDLDTVHVREPQMTAPELLMSESQERMMAFVEPSKVDDVLAVAAKWEIAASVVGRVTDGSRLVVRHQGEVVADIPAASLTEEAPRYDRPLGEPAWMEDLWSNRFKHMTAPEIGPTLLRLLDDPSIASAAWVYEQYDHMLFLNTIVGPGNDGNLLRIKGTEKAIAVSTDGNGRLCYLDPRRGAARIVYEAALNVAMTGARPRAVVDNLNFGNPEKPEVMWQFRETVEGISEACESLGIPIVGGNVSFYNETDGLDIYPTPVVGLVGVADPYPKHPPRLDRARAGMDLWLAGPVDATDLAGSSFEKVVYGHVGGRPRAADGTAARAAIDLAVALVSEELSPCLHDVSDGGLAVAVAEIAIASGVGVTFEYADWRHLFSEDPHRFVFVADPAHRGRIEELGAACRATLTRIGEVGGEAIVFTRGTRTDAVDLDEATTTYRRALPRRLS
ncbi:MAG: phosphoribosylformylglycinamidine synthase subunit PurL [Actinomycetes bacterium]|nr:phosphoribosylformylglycinamidine synthase subunit PurL [Acidimicrobiia bacterium]